MTSTSSLFSNYTISHGQDIVCIANGFVSSIVGSGSIIVSSYLFFYVPKFQLNLVSISHLTKALKCSITFFASYCVIQDLVMKQTIVRGHE